MVTLGQAFDVAFQMALKNGIIFDFNGSSKEISSLLN